VRKSGEREVVLVLQREEEALETPVLMVFYSQGVGVVSCQLVVADLLLKPKI
jgi:ERCC4-type nuclease